MDRQLLQDLSHQLLHPRPDGGLYHLRSGHARLRCGRLCGGRGQVLRRCLRVLGVDGMGSQQRKIDMD